MKIQFFYWPDDVDPEKDRDLVRGAYVEGGDIDTIGFMLVILQHLTKAIADVPRVHVTSN